MFKILSTGYSSVFIYIVSYTHAALQRLQASVYMQVHVY